MTKPPIEYRDRWTPPEVNDARLIGMCNIPKPLFFQAPRNFMGPGAWNKVRKACYENAGYKCEICGYQGTPGNQDYAAHEVYDIDYRAGTSTFVRAVCVCPLCHYYNIHTGRALTMYKHGDPSYTAERLLEGTEHGFKVVAKWNEDHEEKLKVFSAMLDYLKQKELREPLLELIDKYRIEFWGSIGKPAGLAKWGDWKLIYNGEEYKTPYKDEADLSAHLEKVNKREHRFESLDRMKGGVFDEIDNLIKEEENGRD